MTRRKKNGGNCACLMCSKKFVSRDAVRDHSEDLEADLEEEVADLKERNKKLFEELTSIADKPLYRRYEINPYLSECRCCHCKAATFGEIGHKRYCVFFNTTEPTETNGGV